MVIANSTHAYTV